MKEDETRIEELVRTTVPHLKERWPKLKKYSDKAVAELFNDFYFSEDAGNNDEKFPTWFHLLSGK